MNPNIPRTNSQDIQTAKNLSEMKAVDERTIHALKRGIGSHNRALSNFQPPSTYSIEITPTEKDVLLGRGGLTNRHKGNAYFRRMVEAEKHKYKSLGGQKKKKSEYSRSIMERVISYGGRFLKKDESSGKWVLADSSTVRKKCSQALRERPLRAAPRTKGDVVKKYRKA